MVTTPPRHWGSNVRFKWRHEGSDHEGKSIMTKLDRVNKKYKKTQKTKPKPNWQKIAAIVGILGLILGCITFGWYVFVYLFPPNPATETAKPLSLETDTTSPTPSLTTTPQIGRDFEEGCIYSQYWSPIHKNNDYLTEQKCWIWDEFGFIARKDVGLSISDIGDFNQPIQGIYTNPPSFSKISFDVTINQMRAEENNTTNLIFGFAKQDSEMDFGLFLIIRSIKESIRPIAYVASTPTQIETPMALSIIEVGRRYSVEILLKDVLADVIITNTKNDDTQKIENIELEPQYHEAFFIGYRMVNGGLISADINNFSIEPLPISSSTETPIVFTRPASVSCGDIFLASMRSTPDYNDVVTAIPCGENVMLSGVSTVVDGIRWWEASWNNYHGWIAESTGSGKTILIFD